MERQKVKAWPFLISRNQQVDYRTLAAPPSILENEASVLLRDAVSESSTQPDGSALYREVHNLPGGDVTLIFRVIPAEERFVGLPGNSPLSDKVRRPIQIFEGIVVEGLHPHIIVTKEDFQVIHEQIEPIYKNFWEKGERRFPTKLSHFFFLSSESTTNTPLTLLVETPFVISSQDSINKPHQEPSISHQDSIPASNKREDQPRQEDVPLLRRGNQCRVILIGVSFLVLLIVVVLLAKLALR